MPPRTAAVKAMRPNWKPLSKRIWNSRKYTRPATAASDPARKKVTEIVRLTLMPIIADASVSWATARIAFPCRVELTNQLSATSVGHDDRERDDELPAESDRADRERRALRDELGPALVSHAVESERDVEHDEGHPDRGDQRCESRCVPQRAVGDALDRAVDDGEERHRDQQRDDDRAGNRGVARRRRDVQDREHDRARDEPRQGEHVAVREVDELEDPVHERVAERDDAVHRASRQPVEPDVDEVRRVLDEVDARARGRSRRRSRGRGRSPPSVSASSRSTLVAV